MPEKVEFKEKFIERYQKLTDWDEFKKYSLSFLRRSIRVNTLKISIEDLKARMQDTWKLDPIPWCNEGFWIDHKGIGENHRRDVGNTAEHQLGYIYIQEAASMIPPLVLDPQPGEVILDMCAAPGSKTTQISQYMKNEGLLVANDYKGIRVAPLGINIQRMGITNTMITLMEGRYFKDLQFDRILVDAPCSGTGTIRKSFKTLRIWNPGVIKRLAGTQKQLIISAFENLKPGGTMVYSTCSCEPMENEAVVSHLLETKEDAELLDIELNLKRSKPILEFEGTTYHPDVKKCLRIWPQDNDTEGFFITKIKKNA
jgi:tRNA (cytosine49-C5)-methyltransferase